MKQQPMKGHWWQCAVLLSVFAFSVTVGSRFPNLLTSGYFAGGAIGCIFVLNWLADRAPIPPEALLLGCFVFWALISGFFIAVDTARFFEGSERLIQVLAISVCVAGLTAGWRNPSPGLAAVLFVAVVLGVYGILSGDFGLASEMTQEGGRVVGYRAVSLASNPNTLGVYGVWGLAAVTFFIRATRRRWVRALLLFCLPVLVASMVYSASRKALVLPLVYVAAWLWLCHRKWVLRSWRSFGLVMIVGAVVYLGVPWVIENTFAGYRLQHAISEEGIQGRDRATASRIGMYRTGLSIMAEAPIAGIGIYQWRQLYGTSEGGYSHSEYLEVTTSTGLVGAALYFSIPLLAGSRLRRLRRSRLESPAAVYNAGVCLSLLITYGVASFALVHVSSLAFWCLMPAIWGFAYGSDRANRAKAKSLAVSALRATAAGDKRMPGPPMGTR